MATGTGGREHDLQEAIATYLDTVFRNCADVWWTAIDHAAPLPPRLASSRKRRGVKRGIPDFHLTFRGRSYWFEVKRPDNRSRLSDAQQREIAALNAAGGVVVVVRSVDEVRTALHNLGVIGGGAR